MIANRIKPVLLAAALFSALAPIADARDNRGNQQWNRSAQPERNRDRQNGSISFVRGLSLLSDTSETSRGRRDGYRNPQRVENNRWDSQGDGRWNRPPEAERGQNFYSGSISFIPGLGAFAGAIDAFRERGNGLYLNQDYLPASVTGRPILAPRAKIIDVGSAALRGNAFAAVNGCSYESGVCVIRGGR